MKAKFIIFFVLINVQAIPAAIKKMDSLNCISSLILAKLGNYENMKNGAFEYIRQNYEKISSSSHFLLLDHSEISGILNSDVSVTSEANVFNSVKRWINYNSTRKQYFDELSDLIKYEYLPKSILLTASQDFCADNLSHKCLGKILNALRQKDKTNFEFPDNSFRDSYSTLVAVGYWSIDYSSAFEIFDLRNEKWVKIENFKCDKILYSSVLLEYKVMLIGGLNKKLNTANTVQSYDLNTGAMENLPPMKYARFYLTALEFKGRVYAIGGYDYQSYLPYVEVWDPALKIWKTLTPMLIARMRCHVGVLDEEIFVVGGVEGKYLSDVESYNPITNIWRKRASMKEKRYFPGVAVVGGYLYAVGGFSTDNVILNTAERYNPKIDKWTRLRPLNKTIYAVGAANYLGKLVIVGGNSNDSEYPSIMEMYDNENSEWISMPSLNDSRRFFNAIKIPWRLATTILSRENPK